MPLRHLLLLALTLLAGCTIPMLGDPFVQGDRDLTPLQRAVLQRDYDHVVRLVRRGASLEEAPTRITPLRLAVYTVQDDRIALFLLSSGAAVTDTELVQRAITRNSPPLVQALLARGAEVNPGPYGPRGAYGGTVYQPYARLSAALRTRIAIANASRDDRPGELEKNLEIIRILLAAGAQVPPDEDVSFSNPLLADDTSLHRVVAQYPVRR